MFFHQPETHLSLALALSSSIWLSTVATCSLAALVSASDSVMRL